MVWIARGEMWGGCRGWGFRMGTIGYSRTGSHWLRGETKQTASFGSACVEVNNQSCVTGGWEHNARGLKLNGSETTCVVSLCGV